CCRLVLPHSCCGNCSSSNGPPTASARKPRPISRHRSGFRDSRWRSVSPRCCSQSPKLCLPTCGASARFRGRMGPELQIIIVTLLFLGLLTAGMPVPFAIAVPAVVYLLMQDGFTALNGLGLMSWGSMNSFALTAVPLFMFMADILSVSGLSNRIYNGLAKLVAPLPGGLLQTNIAGCAIFASVSGSSIATAASIGGVTTTEAAVIGCFLSLLLGFLFGDLTVKRVIEAMHSTVNFTGNILFLIFAAYVFSYAISFAGIGERLTEYIVGLQLSMLQFYLVLFALFTVLGCLIESLGMIVITVPLLFPILGRYGIDPILFGVVLVIYIELGQISPPIGINLFVIQSIWDGKLPEVVYGTIPFHLIMFVVLAMVIFWP